MVCPFFSSLFFASFFKRLIYRIKLDPADIKIDSKSSKCCVFQCKNGSAEFEKQAPVMDGWRADCRISLVNHWEMSCPSKAATFL